MPSVWAKMVKGMKRIAMVIMMADILDIINTSFFLARISRITLFFLKHTFDRIYRINWIFLLFSQFPDGIEKDNPPIGGKN